MRRFAPLVVALLVLAACSSGDDGGGGGDSGTDAAPATSETTEVSSGAAFELTSPAFSDGGVIPVEQAGCDGPNESPPLEWTDVPEDASQLAVTMVDPDADGFVHWVMVGIDPQAAGLEVGELPPGAVESMNDTGRPGYFGPCPPETHTYVFTVHALTDDPGVQATMPGPDALAAVEATSSATAELSGTYTPAG